MKSMWTLHIFISLVEKNIVFTNKYECLLLSKPPVSCLPMTHWFLGHRDISLYLSIYNKLQMIHKKILCVRPCVNLCLCIRVCVFKSREKKKQQFSSIFTFIKTKTVKQYNMIQWPILLRFMKVPISYLSQKAVKWY